MKIATTLVKNGARQRWASTWGARVSIAPLLGCILLASHGCSSTSPGTNVGPDGSGSGGGSGGGSDASMASSSGSDTDATTPSSSGAGSGSGSGSGPGSSSSSGSGSGSGSGSISEAGGTDGPGAPPDAATGNTTLGVLTDRYDNFRTGSNTTETTLTVASVGGGNFGLLGSHTVDGHLIAHPLYLPGVVIGNMPHNVVFAATEHDTVYAFDADNAAAAALWTSSLGTPMDTVVSATGYTGPLTPGSTVHCADMFPHTGITSTPAIDPASGRMYVVTKNFENGVYFQRLHALDVTTGKDVAGSPVVIAGSVPGTGAATMGGMVAFDPYHHLNRPGLLLMGGNIYIAFSSHCDDYPYHGWVFAYSASNLAQKGIFNTTANGSAGGIWQSGMGLAGDGQGNVFFVSGNGDVDPTNRGALLGMSVARLQLTATGLSMMDWWTASNAALLNGSDVDLQSGPMLLPNPRVVVAGGKDANFYLLDPANLGKYVNPGATTNSNIIQQFSVGGSHIHIPVYWDGPNGPTLYVWSEAPGALHAYRFNGTHATTTPVSQYTGDTVTHPGGILSLSSNGTMPGTGVLWATFTSSKVDPVTGGDAWHNLVPGAMYAFDADNLAQPIWTSLANKARDDLGVLAKFNAPVVANGKVFVGTNMKPDGGKLQVYGLLH